MCYHTMSHAQPSLLIVYEGLLDPISLEPSVNSLDFVIVFPVLLVRKESVLAMERII